MKTYLSVLLLFLLFGKVVAQQNFINVPSIEITQKNRLFFQQQINFNELIQSNTTIDYGLGHNFEIGMNILGLNFNEKQKSFLNNDTNDRDPYNPLVLINALKRFELSDKIDLGIGTQLGINFDFDKKESEAGLIYANLSFKDLLIKESRCVIGAYYNSKHYGGTGNRIGAWIGTETPVTKKVHFIAESVLGYNAISYTSLALVYYPKKWLPLTLGLQIPNTKKNAYSIVFELTLIPGAN